MDESDRTDRVNQPDVWLLCKAEKSLMETVSPKKSERDYFCVKMSINFIETKRFNHNHLGLFRVLCFRKCLKINNLNFNLKD